jgi:hypothetical protein
VLTAAIFNNALFFDEDISLHEISGTRYATYRKIGSPTRHIRQLISTRYRWLQATDIIISFRRRLNDSTSHFDVNIGATQKTCSNQARA